MGDDACAWFCYNPSSAQLVSAATDSIFVLLFNTHNTDSMGVEGEGED
jgi:hypothetical protein